MATLIINRSDAFPVGTSVAAYPARARLPNGKPSGATVTSATVAADGSLTLTGLTAGVRYLLWASVGGEHRYIAVEGPQNTAAPIQAFDGRTARAPRTLQDRLGLRRLLTGV